MMRLILGVLAVCTLAAARGGTITMPEMLTVSFQQLMNGALLDATIVQSEGCVYIESTAQWRLTKSDAGTHYGEYYVQQNQTFIYNPVTGQCRNIGRSNIGLPKTVVYTDTFTGMVGAPNSGALATVYLAPNTTGTKTVHEAWVATVDANNVVTDLASVFVVDVDSTAGKNAQNNAQHMIFINFKNTAVCYILPSACQNAERANPIEAAQHRHHINKIMKPFRNIEFEGEMLDAPTAPAERSEAAQVEAAQPSNPPICPPHEWSSSFLYLAGDVAAKGNMALLHEGGRYKARFDELILTPQNKNIVGSLYHIDGSNYWVQGNKCSKIQITSEIGIRCIGNIINVGSAQSLSQEMTYYQTFNINSTVSLTDDLVTVVHSGVWPVYHQNLSVSYDSKGYYNGHYEAIMTLNGTFTVDRNVFELPPSCHTEVADEKRTWASSAAARLLGLA